MFYEVIPAEVFRADGATLTYSSDDTLKPGTLVLIPLGRRVVPGIVLKKVPAPAFPTKPIAKLLHPLPLPRHLLKSISWLAAYYLSPLAATASLMFPANLTAKPRKPAKTKAETTNRQSTKSETAEAKPAKSKSPSTSQETITNIPLNPFQQQALAELKSSASPTKLLRGVTGSGKTNIYLKYAAETLTEKKSVILLVPEIALTSQLVHIFEQTFGGHIVLIHSKQTPAERRATWLKIHEAAEPIVVIGPRSALLTPVHGLGLIIIDEAHESSYYQENTPRYSALRLASFIASSEKIPCVLGSATPNLVDYHLAQSKNSLVGLSQKAKDTALDPQITIVDFRDRANFQKNRYFSGPLLRAISDNLEHHHQTLVFHNRRGSAPLTICEKCGWQALCPNCYLPMSLHADTYTLECHICGNRETVPASCPSCHHPDIIHKGFGTKLLETELKNLFPEAKIMRFDGDNKKDQDLATFYADVKSGSIDILIGTQTLARGLDLPHLATVGIVQADAGLALPDFAAEERAFELLTQVIGRVGRGHLSEASVIVQTYQPDHPVIQTALKADFPAFANYLLRQRRRAALPPYAHLARLSVTYKTEKTTLTKIQSAARALAKHPGLSVSPPAPAFHERTARGYTWQLILKSPSRSALLSALKDFAPPFSIALDPPSLL